MIEQVVTITKTNPARQIHTDEVRLLTKFLVFLGVEDMKTQDSLMWKLLMNGRIRLGTVRDHVDLFDFTANYQSLRDWNYEWETPD